MKKGQKYFKAVYDPEGTPIVEVWAYEVTTVNKNGIYLKCIEKYCEGIRERVSPGKTTMEMGFRSTKDKARRSVLPDLKKDLRDFQLDEELIEMYSEEERTKIVRNIKTTITKIKNLK